MKTNKLQLGDIVLVTLESGFVCHMRVDQIHYLNGVDGIAGTRVFANGRPQAAGPSPRFIPESQIGRLLRRNGIPVAGDS